MCIKCLLLLLLSACMRTTQLFKVMNKKKFSTYAHSMLIVHNSKSVLI